VTPHALARAALLDQVFSGLEDAAVNWGLLRGRATLDVARDVDLLVAADDVGVFEDVLFGLGGIAMPRSLHPWHRFYVCEDPTGHSIQIDVVTELRYSRRLQLVSGLEAGCLERRRKDGAVQVLDPTDLFWTVLLHCLLDKQTVNERRRTELSSVVQQVSRPSPGEVFFASLCPPGWSSGRALEAVARGDWEALSEWAIQLSGGPGHAADTLAEPRFAAGGRRLLRSSARAVYPAVWRRAGLGVTPRIMDVLESVSIEATVVGLRRRPGICDIVIVVPDAQLRDLPRQLTRHRYRRAGGVWNRAAGSGLERVRLLSPAILGLSGPAWSDLDRSSTPMPPRAHCRRASAGTRLLVVALAGELAGRGATGQVEAASDRAWADAEQLAIAHGLLPRLELLRRHEVA